MPVRQAIEKLSDGKEFSLEDEAKIAQDQLMQVVDQPGLKAESPVEGVSRTLLELSSMCESYLRGVQHDPAEVERVDNIWNIVDGFLHEYEFDKIESVRKDLGPLLLKQKKLLADKKIEKLKSEYQS